MIPTHPVYIISKGRSSTCLTAQLLNREGVPHVLAVEPQEGDAYREANPGSNVVELPFSNLGQGSIPARNWCWEDAVQSGAPRHWCLDDNLRHFRRYFQGTRFYCHPGTALRAVEIFTDRYQNIGIAGLNYSMFVHRGVVSRPLSINVHVYSCLLIDNAMPVRWRGRYNEDIDLCLQAFARGYCTVLVNAFTVDKTATMTMKGGNTDTLYQGDGRLRMAKSLERAWPYVARTERRWNRPQHVVKATRDGLVNVPLVRRTDIDWDALPALDELGMQLVEQEPLDAQMSDVAERVRRSLDGSQSDS